MSIHDRLDGAATAPQWDARFMDRGQPDPVLVSQAVQSAAERLLRLQSPEGFWVGELESDCSLEADAILLEHFLGAPQPERVRKLAACIREQQNPDGGWCLYPGGPPNVNLGIKAYFALRLAGLPESDPALRKAQEMVLSLGGIEAANSFTHIYLCLFGQYDWEKVPSIPPEIVLLPSFAYLNIYEISSWSRAILVPLSVLYAFRPSRPPEGIDLAGLCLPKQSNGRKLAMPVDLASSWEALFHAADSVLGIVESKGLTPLRNKALQKAERWMLERLEGSDGLAAIYPAMMNCIMALDCLGYRRNDPVFARQLKEFWRLAIEEEDTIRMQPCFSPVWDTALSVFAAAESGLAPEHPALARAAEWLLSKQVFRRADWAVKNPHGKPGGWFFEFANDPYPDVDDTAMVLLALSRVRLSDAGRQQEAMRRGLEWTLSMQCRDGGWASFDVDNNKTFLNYVPYADHNAMLDPSCSDITGRVLEMLAGFGYDEQSPPARRAVEFLREQQEGDGCWYGRWGANYIYGTCFALRGLAAIGVDMREAYCLRAAEWLRSIQNADGGWGESCLSYDDPDQKGIGPSTAAQTAWALLGLFAAGDFASESVNRGIQFLLAAQQPGGGWTDGFFTGTGFPSVFYLKYHYYSLYFPILALSDYAAQRSPGARGGKEQAELRIVPLSPA